MITADMELALPVGTAEATEAHLTADHPMVATEAATKPNTLDTARKSITPVRAPTLGSLS